MKHRWKYHQVKVQLQNQGATEWGNVNFLRLENLGFYCKLYKQKLGLSQGKACMEVSNRMVVFLKNSQNV